MRFSENGKIIAEFLNRSIKNIAKVDLNMAKLCKTSKKLAKISKTG